MIEEAGEHMVDGFRVALFERNTSSVWAVIEPETDEQVNVCESHDRTHRTRKNALACAERWIRTQRGGK